MKSDLEEPPVRVGLISLGCAKNLVDAEIMLGSLLKSGVTIINDPAQADVVIVNTCSFIDAAQEESVDTILQSVELREVQNRGQGLVVSGCLPQRFREELPKLLPEVDAFMGIDQVADVTNIVQQALANREKKVKNNPESRLKGPKSGGRSPKSRRLGGGAGASIQSLVFSIHKRDSSVHAPFVSVNARPNYIPDYATPRFRLTPRHFAYLKIAEGCNHPC